MRGSWMMLGRCVGWRCASLSRHAERWCRAGQAGGAVRRALMNSSGFGCVESRIRAARWRKDRTWCGRKSAKLAETSASAKGRAKGKGRFSSWGALVRLDPPRRFIRRPTTALARRARRGHGRGGRLSCSDVSAQRPSLCAVACCQRGKCWDPQRSRSFLYRL